MIPELRFSEDLDLVLRLLFETRIKFANLPEDLLIFRRHEGSTTMRRPSAVVARKSARSCDRRALEQAVEPPRAYEVTMESLHGFAQARATKLEETGERPRTTLRRLIDTLISPQLG